MARIFYPVFPRKFVGISEEEKINKNKKNKKYFSKTTGMLGFDSRPSQEHSERARRRHANRAGK